jgi:UDP-GlcNAc:undecaprenyl-phosphate GlcNAc-1-phosphate transferase
MLHLLISFAVSLILTPVAASLARRYKILDRPGDLKIHAREVPYLGGAAMFAGIWLSLGVGLISGSIPGGIGGKGVWGLFGASLIIGLSGVLDDAGVIGGGQKVVGQVMATALAVAAGFRLHLALPLPLDILVTFLYILGLCNAMNLLDGLDGLAAGVASIAGVFGFLLGWVSGNGFASVLSLAIAGAALGFLVYNFHPARVFMGDLGSLNLGFLLASVGVTLTSSSPGFRWFAAPLLVLGVPLADTLAALVRRVGARRKLTEGDRYHYYDILVRERGLHERSVVFVTYCLGGLLGALGFLVARLPASLSAALVCGVFVATTVGGLKLRVLRR